ncbi:MAG TPA: M64 family metallopeptidase [Verrucomicrobiota bacterium]|nr:M64 family metallopeptidase [Verrucomicrobiota bacterium]
MIRVKRQQLFNPPGQHGRRPFEGGTPASCRLTRCEWPKPGTSRRSGGSAVRAGGAIVALAATGLLVAVVASVALCANAQPFLQTIRTNGPTANRLNVVILSEGYTSTQLAQFLVDATNTVDTILSHPPYAEYSNYVNAFAIKVASDQSGSDHPGQSITNSTYFNSTYDLGNYFVTIPPDATGQGRVDALLQTFMPQCHLSILLVNDLTPGGSDGFNLTAIVSIGAVAAEAGMGQPAILTHETGHVLANLGDEYTTEYPGFPDIEEPNTTRETNRAAIKWNAWISTNTPVPTPNSYGDGIIGLFEGAHYHSTGWYRPQLNCAMGSFGVPFCAVCREALVLAIYREVRPVDAFWPASTNLSVSTTQALSFGLTLLQPATHNLSVQWFTNGVPCSGATNSTFTLLPRSLSDGSNWVAARVKDDTPWVRTDSLNLLSQTVTWALNVNLPQLRLDSPTKLPGGRFAFRVVGTASQGVVIQSSTNLLSWLRLTTNSLVAGQFWYTNSQAGASDWTFYRAVTPP